MGEHNMTKLIISASLLAILATTSNAHAQASVNRSIEITGTVAASCTIDQADTAAIAFDDTLVTATQRARITHSIHRTIGTVSCNYPAFISMRTTRGALKKDAGDTCDFSASVAAYNCVRYGATLKWNGAETYFLADGGANAGGRLSEDAQAEEPYTGALLLTVSIDGPDDKPIEQGTYSDTLVVQVGADLL
jgi:hypothetical protein